MVPATDAPDEHAVLAREASASDRSIPPPPEAPPTPARRGRYLVLAVGLAAAALVLARLWPGMFPPPPSQVVTASGRIEGREITLAAKNIQGRVRRLLVDEGQTVAAGQLLAELEAADLEARHATVQGTVANLEAQIAQASLDVAYTAKNAVAAIAAAEASVSSAQAHVLRAKAVLANATADYQRAASLLEQAVISKRERDQAELALRTSEADLEAAEKDRARAEANLALARASSDSVGLKRQQVRALQETRRSVLGQVAEVQANLAERQILAPANGTILSRPVEVGDVVTPGAPILQMVDMSRLYVKVYIPEPDIGKLRLGDTADVFVDAFPNRSFPARISRIHQQAEFTPKNVETAEERLKLVFGVELTFVEPDGLLKPGMPADCTIHWRPNGVPEARHGS